MAELAPVGRELNQVPPLLADLLATAGRTNCNQLMHMRLG